MNSVEMGNGVFRLPEYSNGDSVRAQEMDQESNGSSSGEGTESPRSVTEVGEKWKVKASKGYNGHSQILRIRAEDSRLGEGIGEGNLMFGFKDNKFGVTQFMIFSRPILPASPLSIGRTASL